MIQAIHLGPLALPFGVVVFFVATLLAFFVGKRISRKTGLQIENKLYLVLLVGLVMARLLFVLQYSEAYFSAPLSIFDIRDGGWKPTAGIGFAWLFSLYMTRKTPQLRKPVLFSVAVFSIVSLLGLALMKLPASADSTTPLPAIEVSTLQGEKLMLDTFTGKPVVVNLWATWCGPCRREMPVMQRAQKEHPEIHVVLLNQGESAATVQAYLTEQQLDLNHVLLDEAGEVARLFKQRGLPATLFFNAEGQLVEARLGELSHATLQHQLTAITQAAN